MGISAEVDTSALQRRFEEFTPRLRAKLAEKILGFVIGLQSWVRGRYLSGDPLHQRTSKLFNSINYAPVKVTDKEVSSSVGTNTEYAHVHEFGGTFHIPEYTYIARKSGLPVTVRAHDATYPQRAFLAPALRDKTEEFFDLMDEAVQEAT